MASLDIPKREGNLKNPDELNTSIKSLGEKASMLGRLATEGVPELLFGDDGTIPWYMSLAPGADLTDKLMEGKRPGLLDMPGIGTVSKFAMLPIAKFGSKEIAKGTARMGKTARNVDKTKEASNFVKRFHRTPAKNTVAIDREGLRIMNPNRGENTADIGDYMGVNFLGLSPTNIPVLRRFENHPDLMTTYEVNIPKSEYWNTPRVRFKDGRTGAPTVVPKGESSLTWEGDYKIDTFGKDIPPEWLRKIPAEEIRDKLKSVKNDREFRSFALYGSEDEGNEVIGNASSRLGKSNPSLYKRHLGDFGMLEKNGDVPSWDLDGLADALEDEGVRPHYDSEGLWSIKDYFSTSERFKNNQSLLDDAIDAAQKDIAIYGGARSSQVSPYRLLQNHLNSLPSSLKVYYKPGDIPGLSQPTKTIQMPKMAAFGSVSGGTESPLRTNLRRKLVKEILTRPKGDAERTELVERLKRWMDRDLDRFE